MVYQIISLIGAVLILAAFCANQAGKLANETVGYQLLNLLGGACLFITAVVTRQYGFILLEGAWVIVSAWALTKIASART
ncbi:MAG TPA: hypothetical protein VHL58_10060 [Thermoanaerobaculia bacterium]|nr:hypothetical protein [Thermoanaerobaculia bacterium]